jgi:hypothetical protein
MYVDAEYITQRLTEDANRLWEQRSAEYVADVKQNPAAHLAELEVAAYVAKLDSICAAAEVRVKNEVKAIPQQNRPAIIAARERVMEETMSKLRVDPLPKAVHWPYVGQAFPLLEKFYAYPHNERPPESLQRQIQQVTGLKKCIVSV